MKSLKKIIATGFAAAAVLTASASAFGANGPSYARVRRINFAGTGCPAGSVAGVFASDLTAFRMYLDDFVAETGPGVPLSAKRKNCQISVDFDFPAGWSFALGSVEYRGYVGLDAGVTASQTSTYYFQGSAAQARLSTSLRGPLSANYKIKDTLAIEGLVWSPCGLSRALNINSQVRVDSAGASRSGVIALDRIDARIAHVYGVQWRRCN